jgi:hypothetical protein
VTAPKPPPTAATKPSAATTKPSAATTKPSGDELARRKAVVDDVLLGKAGKATTQDDLLQFAVALLEAHEPAWLEARLKDTRYAVEHRTTVGLELRGPLRRPLLTALGVPPFVIG